MGELKYTKKIVPSAGSQQNTRARMQIKYVSQQNLNDLLQLPNAITPPNSIKLR